MRKVAVLVVAVAFGVIAAFAYARPAGVAAQAEKIEAGKKVYATQKCATCHVAGGAGGKMATALDGVGSKLTAAELKLWITDPAPLIAKLKAKPKVSMKKYTLPDADLDALVAYLASLKK